MTKRLTIALIALAVVLLFVALPASARIQVSITNISTPGATVFIGEQGLNLTFAQTLAVNPAGNSADTQLGWWASAANLQNTAPTKSISIVGRNNTFQVTGSDFSGYLGNWYLVNITSGFAEPQALINVQDPSMDVRIWDNSFSATASGSDVTGGSVIQGDILSFRVDTNIYQAFNGYRTDDAALFDVNGQPTGISGPDFNNGTKFDGYVDIKVKTSAGNTLTALWNKSAANGGVQIPITNLNVTYQPWFWGTAGTKGIVPGVDNNWSTGATDTSGQNAYPPGTYTVTATSYLNAMYDNYLNGGAYYTTKTVSNANTVTIASNTVSLTANQDTVVRSKTFSTTITGRPNTWYYLWVKSTSSMAGNYNNAPITLQQSQAGVQFDNSTAAAGGLGAGGWFYNQLGSAYVTGGAAENDFAVPIQSIGAYKWQNGGGATIYSQSAGSFGSAAFTGGYGQYTLNGTLEYAYVELDQTGSRTVGWNTNNWTDAQQYTIRVEQLFGTQYKSDEVTVTVQKGAVTIVAAGDQSYYLGEQVDFSGTNTESYDTYLFIVGPNLPTYGGDLNNPHNPVPPQALNGAPKQGVLVDATVAGDNTWSYNWGTSNIYLDAGTYTVYAVSQPSDSESQNLNNVAYGTVSIVIKKPFVSATASQSTLAQGDELDITGTAQGDPTAGVQIWILGKNYAYVTQQSVNSDSSFTYVLEKATTAQLYTGQYFVVVQHPMMNNVFDITTFVAPDGNTYVINKQSPTTATGTAGAASGFTQLFQLTGNGALQGSDAANALVEGINSANVDDTYTKLQFLVEVPTITVDPIGDRHVGDKFTITGETNLAVGDQILVQIYSSSFAPTQKSQSGAFSGATGTVTVVAGTSTSGLNAWSFDVDASTFKPDEYLVQASAVLQDATGTALFNVLEGAAPTAAPTAAVTTAAPTMAATTMMPTPVATTVVPTTTKSPGFGALVALIGLGAVAFVIVRRH